MPGELRGVAVRPAAPARRAPPPAGWPGRGAGAAGRAGASPAAIAPEDTSTTSRAARRARPASASTSGVDRSGSMPPAAVVSDDEPTLTTTRAGRGDLLAPVTLRSSASPGSSSVQPQRGRRAAPTVARRGRSRAGARRRRGSRRSPRSAIAASIVAAAPAAGALLEPGVLAARAEQLGAGRPSAEVEDHGVVAVADEHRRRPPRRPPRPAPPRRRAGEPVGEVADGLVVGEVGLPHPALRLVAADPEAVLRRSRSIVELRAAAGLGAAGSRCGWARRRARRRGPRRRSRPSRRPAPAGPRGWPRRPGSTGSPRASSIGADELGQVAAVGHVDLVQRDQPRPVGRSAPVARRTRRVRASITSRSVSGSRPGSIGARSRARAPAPRSARRGGGSPGPGPGPRWRPGSARARRRR